MKNAIKLPKLRSHFTLVEHSDHLVELRWGAWNTTSIMIEADTLSVRLVDVLDALDGSTSREALASKFNIAPEELGSLLDQLAALNLLDDGPYEPSDVYFELYASPYLARERKASSARRINIISNIGEASALSRGISTFGLELKELALSDFRNILNKFPNWQHDGLSHESACKSVVDLTGNDVNVIFCTQLDPSLMLLINRALYTSRLSAIYCLLDGPFVFVGPTVNPGAKGCFECFEQRVFSNLRATDGYLKFKRKINSIRSAQGAFSPPAAMIDVALSLAALEVGHLLSTGKTFTTKKIMSFYVPSYEFSFHDLLPVSHCGTCGSSAYREDVELYMSARDSLCND